MKARQMVITAVLSGKGNGRVPIVYLGIGTNLGQRETNIRGAAAMLDEKGINVLALSSFHETKPWGVTDQPMFLNAAARAETSLSPNDLLGALKEIEKRMGRLFDSSRWGPRVIDLDILFYGSETINEPGLVVPQKHLRERAFVLEPLSEIAPDYTDPVTGMSVLELRDELRAKEEAGH